MSKSFQLIPWTFLSLSAIELLLSFVFSCEQFTPIMDAIYAQSLKHEGLY
jgi:hypothetical protein